MVSGDSRGQAGNAPIKNRAKPVSFRRILEQFRKKTGRTGHLPLILPGKCATTNTGYNESDKRDESGSAVRKFRLVSRKDPQRVASAR